jgi:predicted AlkP superfamily phosphohydrolase/phosphomutase
VNGPVVAGPRRAVESFVRRRIAALFLALVSITATTSVLAQPKVVVLGFDGADAKITQELIAAGKLPNLAKLQQEGGFWPLMPTNPPQTPVSWSTFATGLNPGRTEIFDFIKKKDHSYVPTLCSIDITPRRQILWGSSNWLLFALAGCTIALVPLVFAAVVRSRRRMLLAVAAGLVVLGGGGGALFARWVPQSVPAPRNNRKGETFWHVATSRGMKARILQVPVTFPADKDPGLEMLSGLGVPDMRGLNGQPTLYTTRAGVTAGQFSVKVVAMSDPSAAVVHGTIEGPLNLLFPSAEGAGRRLTVPMTIAREPDGRLRITAGDRESVLAPGQWSDWHVLEFAFNPLIKAKGMVRFYDQSSTTGITGRGVAAGAPFTEVLMSPIHFHPKAGPLAGFCHPDGYSEEIEAEVGLYKTMGWASDTWTVGDELAAEQQALEDIQFTTDGFEKILLAELKRPGTDLYVQVFAFTDRLQHIFWRLRDVGHPNYDAALAARYGDVIDDAYVRMDAIVGKARALAPDATFFVLSDHGFASFRRGVNYNRWLIDHGYMVLKPDPCIGGTGGGRSLDDLFDHPQSVFSEVDWSRTRAYAMGLGNIYVNLAGREPEGVVRPGKEYDDLLASISSELEALVDPATGERPIAKVHRRDDMYSGYDAEVVPDLRVSNNDHYRVSWDTILGGYPCDEIDLNMKPWGGDHCSVEPSLVQGILLCSKPLHSNAPVMVDVAPTILTALGIPVPQGLDGVSRF